MFVSVWQRLVRSHAIQASSLPAGHLLRHRMVARVHWIPTCSCCKHVRHLVRNSLLPGTMHHGRFNAWKLDPDNSCVPHPFRLSLRSIACSPLNAFLFPNCRTMCDGIPPRHKWVPPFPTTPDNSLPDCRNTGVYETPGGTILYQAHRAMESICLDRAGAPPQGEKPHASLSPHAHLPFH